jgi:hypothetical protein
LDRFILSVKWPAEHWLREANLDLEALVSVTFVSLAVAVDE